MLTDYEQKISEIKSDILFEIARLLGYEEGKTNWIGRKTFRDPFYMHWCEGEVASTFVCTDVVCNAQGLVSVRCENDDWISFKNGEILQFTPESLIDLFKRLKEEVKADKIAVLRDYVRDYGGRMTFDGTKKITIWNGGFPCSCDLKGLRASCDVLTVHDLFEGDEYDNPAEELEADELDGIIEYVRQYIPIEDRIALTIGQKELVRKFKEVLQELSDANIGIIRDNLSDALYFINREQIEEFETIWSADSAYDKFADITDYVTGGYNDSVLKMECFLSYYFYSDGEKVLAKFK